MDTQVSLSPDLVARIEHAASVRGVSVSDFVRESVEVALAQKSASDPLFADNTVFRDEGSDDYASNHDEYLYGDAS